MTVARLKEFYQGMLNFSKETADYYANRLRHMERGLDNVRVAIEAQKDAQDLAYYNHEIEIYEGVIKSLDWLDK